ncbi:unnamed protein product [Adineta steineri]|uniref:F-box domain-containing protein n=1 Tax=Adineta steineri TaxID=433720 RepID=A0A818NJ04_9BILA|nr:unnamed protein product [Adineta steineri]
METTRRRNIETTTWFDYVPTEVLLMIFNYLSNNDIIYTFLFFNTRFNNLILQNQRYLQHLELPKKNFDTWKNILSIIGCLIESLNTNTFDFLFPLAYFPNLKSFTFSSSDFCLIDHMELIIKSKHFQQLHSFKIGGCGILFPRDSSYKPYSGHIILLSSEYVLENVFTRRNTLKIFHSALSTGVSLNYSTTYQTNANLHSLKLVLAEFRDIFKLISYTPNLEYLNVHCTSPATTGGRLIKTNIRLKSLYLKFSNYISFGVNYITLFNIDRLIDAINQFSSSLTCLSLDFVNLSTPTIDNFLFDRIQFRQLLQSMNELKQFHLYVKLVQLLDNKETLLSQFRDQFWVDHNWSFGMHAKYFYTLPFHFDHLHEFYGGFDDVQSTHSNILLNNDRTWSHVKSIDLLLTSKYDLNFLKQMKRKMPKLTFINFNSTDNISVKKSEDVCMKNHITFDKVTMIKCMNGSLEDEKEWLIHLLPNLKHLILNSTKLPSMSSELTPILNQRIKQLILMNYFSLEPLTEISYFYFSNVERISFKIYNNQLHEIERYADNIMVGFIINESSAESLKLKS